MQPTISELRDALDELDASLVSLLEQRFELTDRVGELKRANGSAVRDSAREGEILERAAILLSDKAKLREVAEIYETIFAVSRRRQEERRR